MNMPVITTQEVTENALGRRLRRFNYGFVGEYPVEPIWLVAKNAEGNVVGGLSAEIAMHASTSGS